MCAELINAQSGGGRDAHEPSAPSWGGVSWRSPWEDYRCVGLCSPFPNRGGYSWSPCQLAWQDLSMRSGEPLCIFRAWGGSGLPPLAPASRLCLWTGFGAVPGAFWLLGTSAIAVLGEFVRLCFEMAVWVYATGWRADGNPFVLAEDCLQGDAAYV